MANNKYGWIKDKFNPKAVYHLPIKALPPSSDLSQYLPDVRNQGQIGSCTGFGIGGMAGSVAKQQGIFQEWWSPTFLYNGARFLEGTLSQDAGARPEDVYAWIIASGLLWEHFWPYDPNKLDQAAPSSLRISEAFKYAGIQAIRVDNGVDGIISALASNHCVAIGSPWPQEWETGSIDILPIPTAGSVVAGGHETLLYGHDLAKAYFNDQNSWGIGWSSGGRCKIPFEAINWFKVNGGYDAHYLIWSPSPAPPVPPVPPTPISRCGILDLFHKVKGGQR